MKLALALALVTVSASGCSTDKGAVPASSVASDSSTYAATLMSIEDSAARAAFDAMSVEGEHDGGYHTTKKADGELRCVVRTPWGAPASYFCDMDGVLSLEGAAAEAMYEAFQVEGEHDGGYHTTKKAQGSLSCVVRTPFGAPASYWCDLTEAEPQGLLSLEGASAEAFFDALAVEGEHDGGYFTTKQAYGELRCVVRTPWGAPASYSCSLGNVLSIEGSAARAAFDAFNVEGEHDGGYHTTKKASGNLVCRMLVPWGAPASYSCELAN
jgi:predicted transposase YbfD/YdcC